MLTITKRQESENVIRMLAEYYPKCFFENPRLRKPLKKNIADDLKFDRDLQVAPELIDAAVDWYQSHIGYQMQEACAGAKRLGLNGEAAGAVTPSEATVAQQEVDRINHAKNAQRNSDPIEVLREMHATGRISDDGVKKLDAITAHKPPKASTIVPEFIPLQESLTTANAAVAGISDPSMRLAVAKAVLGEVIRKATALQDELH
jgi:sRNA-binding protein